MLASYLATPRRVRGRPQCSVRTCCGRPERRLRGVRATFWLTDPLWWAQQQPQLDVSVVIAPGVGASTTIAPRAAAATMFRRCPSTNHHLEGISSSSRRGCVCNVDL